MPLFDCQKCGYVENTALAPWFWLEKIQECSQCHEGKWHGVFQRYKRLESSDINTTDVDTNQQRNCNDNLRTQIEI